MTIAADIREAGPFAGDGVTTALPFTFRVFAATDLVVEQTTSGVVTALTYGSQYTVTLNGNQETSPGGTVNLLAAAAVGTTTNITSDVPATQSLALVNGGEFPPTALNAAFDKLTVLYQQAKRLAGRALRVPLGESGLVLPAAATRLGKLLGFDGSGNAVAYPLGNTPNAASSIAITDAANRIAATDVEAALQELTGFVQFELGGSLNSITSTTVDRVFKGGSVAAIWPAGSPTGYNATTGEITIQAAWGAGWYRFAGVIDFGASNGATNIVRAELNGSTVRTVASGLNNNVSGPAQFLKQNFVFEAYLTVGQVVRFSAALSAQVASQDSATGAYLSWGRFK